MLIDSIYYFENNHSPCSLFIWKRKTCEDVKFSLKEVTSVNTVYIFSQSVIYAPVFPKCMSCRICSFITILVLESILSALCEAEREVHTCFPTAQAKLKRPFESRGFKASPSNIVRLCLKNKTRWNQTKPLGLAALYTLCGWMEVRLPFCWCVDRLPCFWHLPFTHSLMYYFPVSTCKIWQQYW